MKILSRDDILKVSDIKKELVKVPEWGGSVYVRGMTGKERDSFEESIVKVKGSKQEMNLVNLRAKLAARTICDEEGKAIFTEADIMALSEKSGAALQRIFAVARKLSGIGDDEINEMKEGLEESPFDGSPSD